MMVPENNRNWIKLSRKLLAHDLWRGEPFTRGQAWVDLLMLANHAPGVIFVRGIKVSISRGQVGWSVKQLAIRWKWSEGKVTRYLAQLCDFEMVLVEKRNPNGAQNVAQKNAVSSLITIINYDGYQGNGAQNESETERRRSEDGAKTETNKKNKERKENNRAFAPPFLEEVKNYCLERNRGVDPEKWFDFYQAKGWMVGKNKMKDWQAAVRTWERITDTPPPKGDGPDPDKLARIRKALPTHED